MKKLYAIATAVAVTLTASAATSVRADHQGASSLNANQPVSFSQASLNKAVLGGTMKHDKNKVRKAGESDAPTTIPNPVGTWASAYLSSGQFMNNLVDIYQNEWTEGYYLYNLLGEGTDIEVDITYVEYQTQTGTVTYPTVVIPGDGQVTLFTQDGQPFDLFLGGIQDGQFYIYTNDIEFVIDQETGTLFSPYENSSVAFVNTATMYGGWVDDMEFYFANGSTSGSLEDYESGVMAPYEQPVYGFQQDDALYILGFCFYPEPLVFMLDPNSNKAYAKNQVAWYYQGTEPFYYVNSDTGEALLNATYTRSGEVVSLNVTDPWMTFSEVYGYYDKGENTKFVIDLAPQSLPDMPYVDGIESISVDNNAFAAVEYFNLQGARISNPAAGQIVIRRQGNAATKVLVK